MMYTDDHIVLNDIFPAEHKRIAAILPDYIDFTIDSEGIDIVADACGLDDQKTSEISDILESINKQLSDKGFNTGVDLVFAHHDHINDYSYRDQWLIVLFDRALIVNPLIKQISDSFTGCANRCTTFYSN